MQMSIGLMKPTSLIPVCITGTAFLAGVALNLYRRTQRVRKQANNDEADDKRRDVWNSAIFFPSRGIRVEDPRSSLSRLESYLKCARSSIKISVMNISGGQSRRLIDLLVQKHTEGVLVKVYTATGRAVLRNVTRLKKYGIEARSKAYAYSTTIHHKFIVIDDFCVLTGSLNWTDVALEHQNENLVIVNDPEIVPRYCERFEYLWSIFDEQASRKQ